MKRCMLCLMVFFLCVTSGLTQSRRRRPTARLSQPTNIEIPKELLQQLMRDDSEVRNFVNQGLVTDEPSGKFTADLVDLNGDRKSEYIVSPPLSMMGNSSGPAWIYRRTSKGYERLFDGGWMSYRVLRTSTNGYSDLEAYVSGSMGTDKTVLSFNGRKYIVKSNEHTK